MKKLSKVIAATLFATVVAAATFNASKALAAGGGGCNKGINCLDVYNPVICSNGQIYSNLCYAKKACATGCVAY